MTKNCQSTKYYESKMCSGKKCKESTNMQPVKTQMDAQLKKPAINSSNKKSIGLSKDKNCQAIKCENTDSKKVNLQGVLTKTIKKISI